MKRPLRAAIPRKAKAVAAVATLMLALPLTACSSGSIPTCSEFAQMAPDTGLMSDFNSQQEKAVRAALSSGGYETGGINYAIGRTAILAYCNIYGGVANANKDSPISNAIE